MGVDKYFPVQGSNKFRTVSFPVTDAFAIDFGAGTTGTHAIKTYKKGSIVLGFVARVTEAMESAGSATIQLGFTGKPMLTSAIGSGVATLGAVLYPIGYSSRVSSASSVEAYILAADDSFDLIVGTTSLTAGKVDVFLTYIPIPVDDLTTSDFYSVVTT